MRFKKRKSDFFFFFLSSELRSKNPQLKPSRNQQSPSLDGKSEAEAQLCVHSCSLHKRKASVAVKRVYSISSCQTPLLTSSMSCSCTRLLSALLISHHQKRGGLESPRSFHVDLKPDPNLPRGATSFIRRDICLFVRRGTTPPPGLNLDPHPWAREAAAKLRPTGKRR